MDDPKLATGELRTGVGLTEPDAGTDLQGIKTKAVLDGDHYIVNGSKMWITNGRYANPLPVLVKTDTKAEPAHKGMSVLLMDQNAEGFEISKDIGKLGYKGPESCLIMFSDVKVHKSMLLGEVEGRGLQQVLSALEIGRLNIAARAVGIAQESYNQALAYSKERKAFGKEINEFQAVCISLLGIIVGWVIYDFICRSKIGDNTVTLSAVVYIFIVLCAYFYSEIFSGRGAFTQLGVMIGTIMVANVAMVIIPGQKKVVKCIN